MTHVSRHEVDLDHAKRLRDGSRRLIPTMSRRFREKPDLGNAETLGTCALDVVQCNVLLDPAAEENVELIRIAARTAALHWALHHSGGRPVEMPIASDAPERVEGNVDESELSSASWLKAFHLAALADDPIALAAICYAPIDVWRSSPTKTEEYTHLFADAMRKYVLRDETAGATLLDALRASDPARRQYLDVDWILDIDVPVIEVATTARSSLRLPRLRQPSEALVRARHASSYKREDVPSAVIWRVVHAVAKLISVASSKGLDATARW